MVAAVSTAVAKVTVVAGFTAAGMVAADATKSRQHYDREASDFSLFWCK
jgi:hypothetical protein